MNTPASGRSEGERRKQAALSLLEARRRVYVRRMGRALVQALLDNGQATIDAVRRAVELPGDIDPRCVGAVTGPLALAGIMRRAGYAKSTRPEAHARPLSVWTLLDASAARDWYQANPDLPDPEQGPNQLTLFQ